MRLAEPKLMRVESPVADIVKRGEIQLTVAQKSALNKIWASDLSFLTEKLVSKDESAQTKTEQVYTLEGLYGVSSTTLAKNLETEFKRFMSIMVVKPDDVPDISPSRAVDMYWHLFVLHTKDYREFTQAVFGKFIDHVPSTKEDANASRGEYSATMQIYHKLFGHPDPAIWGHGNDGESCGGGGGDGCKPNSAHVSHEDTSCSGCTGCSSHGCRTEVVPLQRDTGCSACGAEESRPVVSLLTSSRR